MITVDESLLVGSGGNRHVYLHPHDPGKILKIHKPHLTPKHLSQNKWFRRLVPLSHFDANRRDYAEHTKSRARHQELHRHICEIFGHVETNLGHAVIAEHIADTDGSTSLTLQNHAAQGLPGDIIAPLRQLFTLLAKHHVRFRDANARNILVRRKNDRFDLVIIDGLGEANFIPYGTFSKAMNKRKLYRKADRLVDVLQKISDNREADLH